MLQFECVGNKSVSVVLESVVNVNSESEINCYERGFRDGEEHPFNHAATAHGALWILSFLTLCTSKPIFCKAL